MSRSFTQAVKEEYQGLSVEELKEERERQEESVKENLAQWETTSLVAPIVGVILGTIFAIVIIGIPFLVMSIRSIVFKSKLRNRSNIAINRSRVRIEIIDELIKTKEGGGDPEEVEIEVIDPR